MQVPQPVKAVFDAFPLKTYPAIADATADHRAYLESRKHYFGPSSANNTEKTSSFILGVHKIIHVHNKALPSDPISLGQCFILSDKNGLSLPASASTSTTTNSSTNCIMNISYHGAPERELPILIEDCQLRSIISSKQILLSNKKSLAPTDIIINSLIDTKLYDLWTLCLLVEHENIHYEKIFTLSSDPSSPLHSVYVASLLQDVPGWRSFASRNSHLFRDSKPREIVAAVLNHENTAFVAFYAQLLDETSSVLELLVDYVQQNETSPLRLKLIAWLILVDQTLESTRLGRLVQKCTYLESAYKYIE